MIIEQNCRNGNNYKIETLKFKSQEVILKNRERVVIREAEIIDSKNILRAIRTYLPQSNFIPKLEQELMMTDPQAEEWVAKFAEQANSLLLIAEYNGEIIANIDLTGSGRKIMAHTAMIGMGIIEGWRNCGLGTELLQAVIHWARQSTVLELLWLQVYTENEIALAIYRKMGFVDAGLIKDFFKKDGRYFDNLTMTLRVK